MRVGAIEFSPRLLIDLALDIDPPEEVFGRYDISPRQAERLLKTPAFVSALREASEFVREHGLTFRARARAIAEETLGEAYSLMVDENVPANVRADLIKWVAKMAALEPKDDQRGAPGATGFTLNILFGSDRREVVIDGTPTSDGAT